MAFGAGRRVLDGDAGSPVDGAASYEGGASLAVDHVGSGLEGVDSPDDAASCGDDGGSGERAEPVIGGRTPSDGLAGLR
ncbi:hypothetical protein D0T12_20635 [Actinomadura spongiicola]|uniref:Uncharacterized protein n=1 Tax=Actinomadura spongiicola TaxID=2303421 RepID=A0A372GDP3_9ACTN|nr:hypothetical protein D0T12_20635 [Actinomadura spongiicola]